MIKGKSYIDNTFGQHIIETVAKNMRLLSGIGVLLLLYYVYSDLYIRPHTLSLYTRLVPLSIAVPLFVVSLFSHSRLGKLKFIVYNILLFSVLSMMFAKCLVHLYDAELHAAITGTFLVIFIVTLELKTNLVNAIAVYFLPLLIFTILLFFYYNPGKSESVLLNDVYAAVVVGFFINRIQFNLRLKLFKSGYLLDNEKQRTEQLYEETLVINEDLDSKVKQVMQHKEEVQEANEALMESNATKDRFFAIIAHDLKGPFNAILGFSRSLFQNYDNLDEAKKKRYAHNIYYSSNSTYKLLENLLIWAQTQNNTIDFAPQKYKLLEVMSNAIDPLMQAAANKEINVLNLTATDAYVFADKNMLETIFRNLLSNAIKFTPKNGFIEISAQTIFHNNTPSMVEISISDNGLGMSTEQLEKLFVISKNSSTKGTENEEGTGLGLLLCKDFVKKNRGSIKVESALGKGSKFVITLPVEQM